MKYCIDSMLSMDALNCIQCTNPIVIHSVELILLDFPSRMSIHFGTEIVVHFQSEKLMIISPSKIDLF